MSVAADIILIITAIQSNGNLSYTLNVFKTKHFLKSTQLVTRSEKLVATVLKIYKQTEIAKPTGRAKWYAHTLHKKKSSCAGKTKANAKDKISCARAGVNEVRMCRSKCDARAQVKMRSPCAGQNAMRMQLQMMRMRKKKMRRQNEMPKWGAHAQEKKWAGKNEMRMRRQKKDAHAQAKMRCACVGLNECACAGKNEMRMSR